ncbi:hypothetical protein BDY24DRAFT_134549 [Mrakia frigida]|uniref:uncharacterized protein n=1 Tax=Mrakia frigida TaxID=29902 RepID=UPI003FCC219F
MNSVPRSEVTCPGTTPREMMDEKRNFATDAAVFFLNASPSTHPVKSSLAKTMYLYPPALGINTRSMLIFAKMVDGKVGLRVPSRRTSQLSSDPSLPQEEVHCSPMEFGTLVDGESVGKAQVAEVASEEDPSLVSLFFIQLLLQLASASSSSSSSGARFLLERPSTATCLAAGTWTSVKV